MLCGVEILSNNTFIVSEAFQTTISKLGGVDIVVNNASVMNDRLWELEVDVNLVIAFLIFNKVRPVSAIMSRIKRNFYDI